MTAYLDASVVVRKLQREAGSLKEWGQWERAFSSELLRVEVLRAVDRARLRGALTDNEVADVVMRARAILDGLELLQLSPSILNRAAQSFLTSLGTLDALHLASAVRLAESTGIGLTFLTHDAELGTAAAPFRYGRAAREAQQPQAPPQQPPVPGPLPDAFSRLLAVKATVDSSFTVSVWPRGQRAGSAASFIGRLTSNVSPQSRQR